jgi:hypothetical protein
MMTRNVIGNKFACIPIHILAPSVCNAKKRLEEFGAAVSYTLIDASSEIFRWSRSE